MQNKFLKNLSLSNLNSLLVFTFTFLYYLFRNYTNHGLWEDELALMADVLMSSSINDVILELRYELHAPGTWLITYLITKFSQASEFTLRLPSAFMGALGVTMFVNLAGRHLNQVWLVAFWGLLLSLPTLTWHAGEVRPHVYLFAFGSLIIYFLYQATLNLDTPEFYKNVRRAALVFSISIWFHFAAFYMIIGIFIPFALLFHNQRKNFNFSLFKISNFIFYLNFTLALSSALFLVYLNLKSVLWGSFSYARRLTQFTAAGLLHTDNPLIYPTALYCLLFVATCLLLRKNTLQIRMLTFFYLVSLSVYLLMEHFGYPIGRTKYSLYLHPLLSLIFLTQLYQFKIKKILLLIPVTFIALNLKFGVYIPIPKVREMFNISKSFLAENPEHVLVIFGYKRTLSYYLNSTSNFKDRIIFCDHQPTCLTNTVRKHKTQNILVLLYNTDADIYFKSFFKLETIVEDSFGRLLKIPD